MEDLKEDKKLIPQVSLKQEGEFKEVPIILTEKNIEKLEEVNVVKITVKKLTDKSKEIW